MNVPPLCSIWAHIQCVTIWFLSVIPGYVVNTPLRYCFAKTVLLPINAFNCLNMICFRPPIITGRVLQTTCSGVWRGWLHHVSKDSAIWLEKKSSILDAMTVVCWTVFGKNWQLPLELSLQAPTVTPSKKVISHSTT